MPTDLDRMFASLAEDANAARLAPAATVRRRADRRLALRTTAGMAAVAVLVTGAVAGTRLVLTAQEGSPPPPAESGRPVASAPPSPGPATPTGPPPSVPPTGTPPARNPATPSGSGVPIPDSVPARAFLQKVDWPGTITDGPDRRETAGSPRFCGAAMDSDKLIGVRGTYGMIYRDRGLPDDYVPTGTVSDTVTVYRGSGAADFLPELRRALADCPVDTEADGDRKYVYRSLGAIGAGDESLLVEISTPAFDDAGEPVDGEHLSYLGAARTGDTIVLVEVLGWESASAERAAAELFTRKAADRAEAWRG